MISAYNPDLKLKPGLTANVTIFTLQRPNVLTVPSKALRFVPDEEILASMNLTVENPAQEAPPGKRIVWQRNGNTLVPKMITIGTSSLNVTEVVDGLNDNDEIVLELSANAPAMANGSSERSPFMPSPPGGNRNRR